jgi:hypothetical protein
MGVRVASIMIAAISAVIAALAFWNALRSTRTAREALAESRRNNQTAQWQRSRDDGIRVLGDAMRLVEGLAGDSTLAPLRVEPLRHALSTSAESVRMMTPEVRELLDARAPLPQAQVAAIRTQLLARIGEAAWEIDRRQGASGLMGRESA